MKWKSTEKNFFFLFLNFDINYDIHDINYKIWYFCYHAERLINFIFKKKNSSIKEIK